MSVMELPTPLIGNKAHQPRKFQFPQRELLSRRSAGVVSAAMV